MSIRGDLYGYLVGISAITSLISTRLYPSPAPTSATFPYVTFTRTAQDHVHHLKAAAGLTFARYQFDSFAITDESAWSVAEALRGELDGYQEGAINGGGSTVVNSIVLDDEADVFTPPDDKSEIGIFQVRQQYTVEYAETVPTF